MALILNIFYQIFGRPRRETVGQHEAAIKKLQETEEMLKDKKDSLEKNILVADGDVLAAAGDGHALQALKRRKRYERQVEQVEGKMLNVEAQREALENASVYTRVLKNMAFAAEAMRAVHESMDVDNVDEQIQAITEQQETAQDISDLISRPMGPGGELHDEDLLLAELGQMRQQQQLLLLADKKKQLQPVVDVDDATLLSVAVAADSASPAAAAVSPPQEAGNGTPRPPSIVASTSPPLCLPTTNCHTRSSTEHNVSDEPVLKRPRLNL